MKKPEILCHDSALASFKRYPPGSKERAKALGISLWLTYGRVDATLKEWEETERLAEQEEVWKPLGLKSLDDLILQITGKSRPEVKRELKNRGAPVGNKNASKEPGEIKPTAVGLIYGGNPSYLITRLQRDAAENEEAADRLKRFESGGFRSVRQMAIDAGYVREPTGLERLKRDWKKATEDERCAFLAWINE